MEHGGVCPSLPSVAKATALSLISSAEWTFDFDPQEEYASYFYFSAEILA